MCDHLHERACPTDALSDDDEHHRIAIINLGPQLKDKSLKRAGVDHVSMSYNSLERLFEAYSIRKKKGILPHWCVAALDRTLALHDMPSRAGVSTTG
jgi:hypothetical protein